MTAYFIYQIPGRKVGCTKDLEKRKKKYLKNEGKVPLMLIKEIVNGTPKEAGDREWYWADQFGYRRGLHYTLTVERGRSGGLIGGPIGGQSHWKLMTPEQRQEWTKMGGSQHTKNMSEEEIKERGRQLACWVMETELRNKEEKEHKKRPERHF